ncbi:methylthioribose kinase [Priestia aryabhattai]|uniref:DUF7147 family protein n=1 Tax=Priestia TaxID=2800373 RepID=UPI00211C261B|nr:MULTISPECIES: methylthioribose kinase [Priestia]MCQ9280278.1 methylthioribose kinase [Priestia aryabhattai]MEB4867663.1 methylthioribose kinase [Priestia megaterium]
MIQRFIELGEGYSDIYELLEIVKSNKHRLAHLIMLRTVKEDRQVASFVAVLHSTAEGNFQPLYVCREGIVLKQNDSKRVELFKRAAEEAGKEIVVLDVKPSTTFPETALYYQHLIGILRMNRFIPPMQ